MTRLDDLRNASCYGISAIINKHRKNFNEYCANKIVCNKTITCEQCFKVHLRDWLFKEKKPYKNGG